MNLQTEYDNNKYLFGNFILNPIVFIDTIFFDKFKAVFYDNTTSLDFTKAVNGFVIALNIAKRVCIQHKDKIANALLTQKVDENLLNELILQTLSIATPCANSGGRNKYKRDAHFTPPSALDDYLLLEEVNNTKGIQIFSHKELPLHIAFKELSEGTLKSPLIVSRNKNRAAGFFLGIMAEKGLLPDDYLELIKSRHLLVSADETSMVPIQSLKNGKSENWAYITEFELGKDDNNLYSRLVKMFKQLDIEGKFTSHPLPYSIPINRASLKN